MTHKVGQTIAYQFSTRNYNNTLYDPAQVQVSFLKSVGVEDVLSYGGSSPRDTWLTRVSTGTYRWQYNLDSVGEWRINERWSDDGFVVTHQGLDLIVQVIADPHSWVDLPVGPSGGQHRVYWGVGAAGIIDPATIEAMTHLDSSSYNFTTTALTAASQKVYIAFPGSWATPSITLDGLVVDMLPVTSVLLHDTDNTVIAYDLYETRNLLTSTGMQFVVTF